MSYAEEKLGLAIYDLAIGEGDIKERLESITKYLAPLSADDFPEHLKEIWGSIISRLTKKESKVKGTKYDEGSFSASMFGMHGTTASQIAKNIVELHEGLVAARADGIWK